jgi:hypothetical protein
VNKKYLRHVLLARKFNQPLCNILIVENPCLDSQVARKVQMPFHGFSLARR